MPMPRRLALLVLLGLCLAPMAFARPPAPPEAERAVPGRPGWSVAADSGCWIWNPNSK
jgi:hypothetical protein